jgi:hypothetical protein
MPVSWRMLVVESWSKAAKSKNMIAHVIITKAKRARGYGPTGREPT